MTPLRQSVVTRNAVLGAESGVAPVALTAWSRSRRCSRVPDGHRGSLPSQTDPHAIGGQAGRNVHARESERSCPDGVAQ
jgi:hypothetical protein